MTTPSIHARYNESFIDIMERLHEIMIKKGEVFRAKAYQKAAESISSLKEDIITPTQLKGVPGIGTTILEKLDAFCKTGTLSLLEREKSNPVHILGEIYGIGPKKAQELVDKGITSISQLRAHTGSLLNEVQQIGLQYYEDILQRIPRAEIVEYEKHFRDVFLGSPVEIVGSYRRGALHSGDIDVILTCPTAYKAGIDRLIALKTVLHVLSRGDSKCLVVARLAGFPVARRVDFLFSPLLESPFALLYFTGSKYFNTMMRHVALSKGYTMNEHGLYVMTPDGKKGGLVDHVFQNEKDIFDFLGLVYKTPLERTDGRAVVESGPQVDPCEPVLKAKKNNTKNKSKKNRSGALDTRGKKELTELLAKANDAYYNQGTPIMTDNEFDILQNRVSKQVPLQIGAPVAVEKLKVALPYFMGSMNKIKPDTAALGEWTQQYGSGSGSGSGSGGYVISCKLDGVSGLYCSSVGADGSVVRKLYTRGDGSVGQDISHWIPYFKWPASSCPLAIRGEFIMKKAVFDAKYKSTFANARNLVAGLLNRLTVDVDKAADVDFVAYEVLEPVMKPSDQLAFLRGFSACGLHVVDASLRNTISNAALSSVLVDWRASKAYQIDGVIVAHDAVWPRVVGANPDHAFAFKMLLEDQKAEAMVVDVLWTPSKDGYLKPRVRIEPVQLGGVKIEYATGFNAAFIEKQCIGVGAVIEIVRSGDVIPFIQRVVQAGPGGPKMPSVPYVWNETGVDVLLADVSGDATVREKIMVAFFRGIGVEGLSTGNVARLIEGGYDSVAKILRMKAADLLKLPGFKDKMAAKIVDGIQEKAAAASIGTLMAGSHCFGRGLSEKKIESILDAVGPAFLTSSLSHREKMARVLQVKGVAETTAELFVGGIPDFLAFLDACGLQGKLVPTAAVAAWNESHPLYKKTVVFTGFRDAALQDALKHVGCQVGAAVSKNTLAVIVKGGLDTDTGKAWEAKKWGIPVLSVEEFKNKYCME